MEGWKDVKVFAVLLDKPNHAAVQRLTEAYPGNIYKVSDTSVLVRAEGLAEAVAVSAGIKGEERIVTGVVFGLNKSYAGYASRSLWEWLNEDEAQ